MIKSYFTIALRNLVRNKMHTFINIAGLSAGMAVTILIGLWIWDECAYESYNPNEPRIARVMQTGVLNNEYYTYSPMPMPLAEVLRTTYGHAFKYVVQSYWTHDHVLAVNNSKVSQTGKFMDPQAPDMLSLNMLEGSRYGLQDPSSILLSASAAKSIFGSADPLNQTMTIDQTMIVKVTGVYEDLPHNSQFSNVFFIAPWKLLLSADASVSQFQTDWGWDAAEIFVQLADHADINQVSASIRNSTFDHLKNDKDRAAYKPIVFLQPMSRWHLYSEFKNGVNTGGRIQFVWLFGLIGIFVLFLACINFMNLSTARSAKRAKEVGIRKSIGSMRGQLIGQFFTESLTSSFIALICALVLVYLCLPVFNAVSDKNISIPWTNPWFCLSGLGCSLCTGLLAGSYPALYLSSFQPMKVLKGGFHVGRRAARPRQILVVLQFTVSVSLIIGTLIVLRQIQYGKNRPIGYNKDGLLSIPINTPEYFARAQALRDALLKTGVVRNVAESSSPTTAVWLNLSGFDWQGKDPNTQAEFGAISVSYDYGQTVGWQFLQGRDFSPHFPTDSSGLILNEAAVSYVGLQHPVGTTIKWDGKSYRVVGVIRDMVMESPYEPVHQSIYYLPKNNDAHFLFVRLRPGLPAHEALEKVRSVFQQFVPSASFSYQFVDDAYDHKFVDEERTGKLAGSFALLAVLISCMGIFGMASFMAEQRTKEIGIRKVLGATVLQLWRLLSRDFVLLSGIALCIALPLSYYGMHQWLQQYPYHPGIPWWIFAETGIGVLLVTLLTVSIQTLSAALANPVRSLKNE